LQKAAVVAGNIDEAVALNEKRRSVIEEMRAIGPGGWPPVSKEILELEKEIRRSVRAAMRDIARTRKSRNAVKLQSYSATFSPPETVHRADVKA